MTDLNRLVGVRVGLAVVAVASYFGTMCVFGAFPDVIEQTQAWDALEWLIIFLGTAVLGDTVRPSGRSVSAFLTSPKAETPKE